jgi:hypothetical protein
MDRPQLLFWIQNTLYRILEYIQKFPDWVDNEIYVYNKHSLRSNKKGYGGKTHWTDSQNSHITAPIGRELHQFSLQAASPEISGYIFVHGKHMK